jgi:iron(III) transport system substrate-binding protein
MKRAIGNLLLALAALIPALAVAEYPGSYPPSYANIAAAAAKEGKLIIYSATDSKAANPLVKDFETLYPGVKVEYNDLNSTELYNRFISEAAAKAGSADVLWSSAMDLQIKLVNDGYAQVYKSPEAANIPGWALWRDEAYGTTYEPIVFVYNKRLMPAEDVPQTHADLIKLLKNKPDQYKGKVTTYDPERSGTGFIFVTQDLKNSPSFWDLAKALGGAGVKLYTSTGAMLERISSGEHLLGYNIIGSYAKARSEKDPSVGIVYPKDYTLVMSRVMFIPKAAKNPNAAKLWVDYILSKRGQEVVANKSELYSIRPDVEGATTAAALTKALGPTLKPIAVGPGLLVYLDQAKRLEFLKQWQQAVAGR